MKISKWFDEIWETRNKIFLAILLSILANLFNNYSGNYVTHLTNPTNMTDLILDNYGPLNLNIIFVWFSIFITFLFYVYPFMFEPKKFYYFVFMGAFLMIIRSIFVTLTHLQNPAGMIQAEWPVWAQFSVFSNDLFFSGHTSYPFLGFLLMRKTFIKYFMLFSSIVIGWSALLMHQHYSIDVFAAFFITYGVYKMGNEIINKLEKYKK